MSDTANVRMTYTPDYADAFAVQRQSVRYHYSALQRNVWWLIVAAQLLVILAIVTWEERIQQALEPIGPPLFVSLAPVAIFVVGSIGIWWLAGVWLIPKLSARWIAQRSAPTPLTFDFDGKRMTWACPKHGSWVDCDAVERMFATPTAICFLVSNQTMFVPKSAFADGSVPGRGVGGGVAALVGERP